MKTIDRPPLSLYREPSDNLDDVLRAFFKSEMPDPWPEFEAPAPSRRQAPARKFAGSVWQSRLALAASVGILLVGCLWMSSGLKNDGSSGSSLSHTKGSQATNKLKLPATPDALRNGN